MRKRACKKEAFPYFAAEKSVKIFRPDLEEKKGKCNKVGSSYSSESKIRRRNCNLKIRMPSAFFPLPNLVGLTMFFFFLISEIMGDFHSC